MPNTPISLDRLAIHTITTKPWPLAKAAEQFAAAGVAGISVWVEALDGMSISEARLAIMNAGLSVPALVRGGFFCDSSADVRQTKIDHNRRLIETANELAAEMLVLVVGAVPGQPLDKQKGWVRKAIEQLLEDAKQAQVKLAIEPLHPMYSADKSCINRLSDARELVEAIDHSMLGVAVDVYHVWWDSQLEKEIKLLGAKKSLFAFHLCDWRVPTRDMLNDRALMGDGCIDIRNIRLMIEMAGFRGWNEVEIFSTEYWAKDQQSFLNQIVERYSGC